MSTEVEISGRKFKFGKINAIKQFHVARRISPILSEALPAMKDMKSLEAKGGFDNLPEDEKLEKISKVLQPFIGGLSKLSDEDSEMVLFTLLSCVEVYQDQFKTWSLVSNGQQLVMQDLELPTLLQAAGRSFMANLSGFFQGPPRSLG